MGHVSVEVTGRLLTSIQTGPFNLAYVQDYAVEVGRMARVLNSGGLYAILVIFRESMEHSPDAVKFIFGRAPLDSDLRDNCVAQAIVTGPDVRGSRELRPVVDEYLRSRRFGPDRGRIFDNEAAARAWLEPILRSIDG